MFKIKRINLILNRPIFRGTYNVEVFLAFGKYCVLKSFWITESGRWRWKLPDGSILEWDKKKGEVEKYDKTGKNHQGGYDPETGVQRSPAQPNRTTPKFTAPQTNRNNKIDPGQVVVTAATIYLVVKIIEIGIAVGS